MGRGLLATGNGACTWGVLLAVLCCVAVTMSPLFDGWWLEGGRC
jgi:hypothetical protein